MTNNKILLIDRDGTLIEEPIDFQVDELNKIRLKENVIPALLELQENGFQFVMISNQDGLGTECFPSSQFEVCHDFILGLFASQGITFRDIFICPHLEIDSCECRKPKLGLLKDFLAMEQLDYERSWVIGDRETDGGLAINIGIPFFKISNTQDWSLAAKTILGRTRIGKVSRETKETSIDLELLLDCNDTSLITTPIPFFSHMLEQIAKHAGICLKLNAEGDIEVDDHHLIEDTALALGETLKQALGDKWGIGRYGFTLPMDESLASIAIDLDGRNYCKFEGTFTREFVGGMATEMVPHFFKSLANSLNAALHIKVQGENNHHMIEACFKAFGRVLRQAITVTCRDLPSTKGVL